MWVTATIFVCGPMRRLEGVEIEPPSSLTSTHFSTAPWRSRRKCHGTMLEWCSMTVSDDLVARADPRRGKRRRHEIDRLGRALVKTISSGRAAFRKRCTALRAVLIGLGRPVGERMQAAMHIGVVVPMRPVHLRRARPPASAPRRRSRDRPAGARGSLRSRIGKSARTVARSKLTPLPLEGRGREWGCHLRRLPNS